MLLPALVLGVSAAFAAGGPSSCLKTLVDDPAKAPATLDDLTACQRRALDDFAARYAQKHGGRLPGDALLDRLKQDQQADVDRFLKAHPDQKPAQARQSGVSTANLEDDPSEPNAQAPASDSAAPDGRALTDEDELKKKLLGTRADGKPNLSDDGAKQINDYLNQKQGGASPDMQRMMSDLQNGGKPSDESIQKLKEAAASMGGQPAPSVDQPPDPRAQ